MIRWTNKGESIDIIDVNAAASRFVEYLNKYGTPDECVLDERSENNFRGSCYKPFYRASALFVAPGSPYRDEMLDGELLTMEEAAEILRLAHPYFKRNLEAHWDSWEHHWKFMLSCWY